jgi:hypothetical protein
VLAPMIVSSIRKRNVVSRENVPFGRRKDHQNNRARLPQKVELVSTGSATAGQYLEVAVEVVPDRVPRHLRVRHGPLGVAWRKNRVMARQWNISPDDWVTTASTVSERSHIVMLPKCSATGRPIDQRAVSVFGLIWIIVRMKASVRLCFR